jgi:hypothetical protein
MSYTIRRHPACGVGGQLLDSIPGGVLGNRINVENVVWKGTLWRVAVLKEHSILFVLCDDVPLFDAHQAELVDMAAAVRTSGSVSALTQKLKLAQPVLAGAAGEAAVSVMGRRNATVMDRKIALEALSELVAAALAAGATFADIRVAVYGAMGLDETS